MSKTELNQIELTDKEHSIIIACIGKYREFTKSVADYNQMYDELKELLISFRDKDKPNE